MSQEWNRLVADLERLLKLRAIPFGMKLFERRGEMETIPRIRRPGTLRVFGCLPGAGARGCTEAGVRKASKEESAGSFALAVVSVYGDLARGCEALARFRVGTPGG